MTQPEPAHYTWWLAGRSAGLVAMLLVTAAVLLGLALAAKVVPARRRAATLRVHQHLALVSLGAIAAHAAFLFADPWLKPGISGILVPFSIGFRPVWTGLGILAGYLAAVLGLSFYVRRRIGVRLWRRMHRATLAVYLLGLAHSLGAGTDAGVSAVRYALLVSIAPIAFLSVLRALRSRASAKCPAPGAEHPRARERPVATGWAPSAITARAASPGREPGRRNVSPRARQPRPIRWRSRERSQVT